MKIVKYIILFWLMMFIAFSPFLVIALPFIMSVILYGTNDSFAGWLLLSIPLGIYLADVFWFKFLFEPNGLQNKFPKLFS